MKTLVAVGALSAAVTTFALMGAATASADSSVVGQKFSDAKATLSASGKTAKVSTTVGDSKRWDDCIVSAVANPPTIDGFGARKNAVVLVNLNCSADKVQEEQ